MIELHSRKERISYFEDGPNQVQALKAKALKPLQEKNWSFGERKSQSLKMYVFIKLLGGSLYFEYFNFQESDNTTEWVRTLQISQEKNKYKTAG